MITHVFKVCGEGDRTIDCDLDNVRKIEVTLDQAGISPQADFNNVWGILNRWVILAIDGWPYQLNRHNRMVVEFDPPLRKLKTPGIFVQEWADIGGGVYVISDVTLAPTTGTIRVTVTHDLPF